MVGDIVRIKSPQIGSQPDDNLAVIFIDRQNGMYYVFAQGYGLSVSSHDVELVVSSSLYPPAPAGESDEDRLVRLQARLHEYKQACKQINR